MLGNIEGGVYFKPQFAFLPSTCTPEGHYCQDIDCRGASTIQKDSSRRHKLNLSTLFLLKANIRRIYTVTQVS